MMQRNFVATWHKTPLAFFSSSLTAFFTACQGIATADHTTYFEELLRKRKKNRAALHRPQKLPRGAQFELMMEEPMRMRNNELAHP